MKLSSKGFTLIELVITMLIVVIVFGILANLVGFSTTFFRDENTQVANQTALRQVAVTFEKDVRKYALNSSLITGDPTCPVLGTTITYCYDSVNKLITRNGVVVANGILKFESLTTSSKVHLVIETKEDSRGQDIKIEYDVYFRTDK